MKEPIKSKLITLALLCASLLVSVDLSAKEVAREITIQWNADNDTLHVKENEKTYEKSEAYSFELRKDDKVLLVGLALLPKPGEETQIQIEYTITGLDATARFSKRVKDYFKIDSKKTRKFVDKTTGEEQTLVEEIVQVTDDLLPGGILTVSFKTILKIPNEDDKEETKIVKFKIKDEYPWFFGSVGMIFTVAKNPEIAIIKTKNIVTVDTNGDTQQAYEQKIVKKDNSLTLRPLQSAVSFLNFRIYKPLYISLGILLNQNIFTEPMIGLSYFYKVKNVGWAGTAGVHFHKETEIDSRSGFKDEDSIDPSLGLTVDEISTEEKYQIRFFFGFSFRF